MKYCLIFLSFLFLSFGARAQTKIIAVFRDSGQQSCADTVRKMLVIEKKSNGKRYLYKKLEQQDCYFRISLPEGEWICTAFIDEYENRSVIINAQNRQSDSFRIVLPIKVKILDSVVVRPRMKKFIHFEGDKLVVQVASNPLLSTGDLYDALEKTPGIMLQPDGSVILKGKPNVTIWVDGRPTGLSGDNLSSLLRSFPANSIEKFELISNPGAGYDAAATGGIINIVTYKGMVRGTTYSLQSDVSVGYNWRSLQSLRISNRSKKANTTFLTGFSAQNSQYTKSSLYRFTDTAFNRNSAGAGDAHTRQPYVYAATDIDLTKKITIGGKINLAHDRRRDFVDNGLFFPGKPDARWGSDTRQVTDFVFNAEGVYAVFKLKKKDSRLNFNIDHSGGLRKSVSRVEELNRFSSNARLLYSIVNNEVNQNIWTFETRFNSPVGKNKGSMAAGIKSTLQDVESDSRFRLQSPAPVKESDYNLYNGYRFNENVHAAFAEYSRKWKKLNFYGGLRLENVRTRSRGANGILYYDTAYTNLFPNLRLNFDASVVTLDASYSRKIARPAYGSMDPNLFYLDSFSQRFGNPALRPTPSNNYEFGLYVKGYPLVTYTFASERNTSLVFYKASGGILTSTFENLQQNQLHNIFFVAPVPFHLILKPRQFLRDLKANKVSQENTDYIAFFYNSNRTVFEYNGRRFNNSPVITYGAMFKVDMKKYFVFSGYINYNRGGNSYFYQLSPFSSVDLNLSRYFFAKKLFLRAYVKDLFDKLRNASLSQFPGINVSTDLKNETRRFGISLTYNLGKFAFQNRGKHDININEAKGQGNYRNGIQ